MADQRIEKWTRWIERPIKNSVVTMHHHRQIWQGVAQVIREHGALPDSAYWRYHSHVYVTTQAVGVRRQADLHRDAASLGKLISEIKGDAAQLTSDWWVGLWPNEEHDQRFARRQWITKFGGEVGDHLDPAIPATDLATLTAGAASVKGYVDKHVAHSEDPGPVPAQTSVTLDEVHDAIDVIGGLFRRYYLLFTAGDMVFLEPIIQHDWLAPFRMPWIRGSK